MISILLGPDDYGKREYIGALAKKIAARVESFHSLETVPMLGSITGTDLFSKETVYVFNGLTEKLVTEDLLPNLQSSKNYFIFVDEKLDKRTNLYKFLSKQKSVMQDFGLPHGKALDAWIQKRAAELGGAFEPAAVDLLAKKLGRDDAEETKFGGKVVEVKEVYTLWQANSEVQKLLAYSQGKPVTAKSVEDLVPVYTETDVLQIVNAIGEGNKTQSLKMIDLFLASELVGDEKSKIIQLNALLADQFRNIAIIHGFTGQGKPDDSILEATGWKSGRLFVLRKISARFNPKKVQEFLPKLEALDEELKTGSTPPRVLLDLIMVQLLS
jgi:DNA polymerase III delta subunit